MIGVSRLFYQSFPPFVISFPTKTISTAENAAEIANVSDFFALATPERMMLNKKLNAMMVPMRARGVGMKNRVKEQRAGIKDERIAVETLAADCTRVSG